MDGIVNLTKSTKHAGRKLPFAAKPKLVRVEWVDAHSDDSWQHEEDVNYKPRPITTSGYLIWKDKETMVIAGSIDAEPPGRRYANTITILNVCVRSVRVLKEG